MWAKFIQLFLRTLCAALALGILPKPDEVKSGAVRAGKRRREAGGFSQPPGDSFCTALDISEAKLCSATTAHKGPNANYYNYHVGEKWTNLTNYDLVIRSDLSGIDNAVSCICAYLGE